MKFKNIQLGSAILLKVVINFNSLLGNNIRCNKLPSTVQKLHELKTSAVGENKGFRATYKLFYYF